MKRKNLSRNANRIMNSELRHKAHKIFDALWKDKHMSRKQAYELIQSRMNLSKEQAHIRNFDILMCYQLISIVDDYKKTLV